MAYDWPGNVRQLSNVVENMVVVDYDGVLDVDDLPAELAAPAATVGETSGGSSLGGGSLSGGNLGNGSLGGLVGKPLAEIEKLFIAETLRLTGGNREEAASLLGIGERTLYRKIKEYDL